MFAAVFSLGTNPVVLLSSSFLILLQFDLRLVVPNFQQPRVQVNKSRRIKIRYISYIKLVCSEPSSGVGVILLLKINRCKLEIDHQNSQEQNDTGGQASVYMPSDRISRGFSVAIVGDMSSISPQCPQVRTDLFRWRLF